MNKSLSNRQLLGKTASVGGLTLLSRLLAIARELLLARFFGIGPLSDAFIIAFRMPNLFRQVFAEGALSGSIVPLMVKLIKHDEHEQACKFTTLALLTFSSIILVMYGAILWNTNLVLGLIAPGFDDTRIALAAPFLRILFPFLLCICISALLNGALQSIHRFVVPALGTPIWNTITILGIVTALHYHLSASWICAGMIAGAVAQCTFSFAWYLKSGFSLRLPDAQTFAQLRIFLTTFGPSFLGASVSEINFLVSGQIASFLPIGSVSLLFLGSRFVNIPLGVFAVALSTVLLPHFSGIVLHAPQRLRFYLLEVAKLVTWLILPSTIGLMYLSESLFFTFVGHKATAADVSQGGIILILYTIGLPFLCLNKSLLSMLYALKDTRATMQATILCAVVNIVGDLIGTNLCGSYGIAAANTLAALSMTLSCLYALHVRHHLALYPGRFALFLLQYAAQLALVGLPTSIVVHMIITRTLAMNSLLQYPVVGVYGILLMAVLYLTRKNFGIKLHFLP